jgi:thioesterase domain-containing protein/acyl carrier protein
VLGLEAVGAEQDFFTLGGHSVKALMLAAAIEQATGVPVPAAAIFERTTVAQQAAWIEEARRYDARHVERRYLAFGEGRPGKLFAFPPLLGYGLAFHQMAQAASLHTFYAFDFPEEGDPIPGYADEVMRLDPAGPYRLVGYSAGGNLAFEVAAELERRGKRVEAVVMMDARRFVEPEILSDAEIEDLVWTNLDNLAGLLLQDEQFRDFVRNRYARERMAAKTRAFLLYERGRTNDGPVRADLHFLCGTDRKVCTDWADVTAGRFLVYEASGRHIEMTHASYGEANGRLIERILGAPEAPGPVQ